MNKYNLITTIALIILVIGVPVYAVMEPTRMEQAQADLRQEFVSDAAVIYVENCALCHGAAGEGIGSMPALDNDGLRTADFDTIYKTIARGRYDTVMAAWLQDEGGSLNEYQINELVALIRYGDWSQVGEMAAEQGLIPPTLPVPEVDEAFLEEVSALGPEGNVWAEGMALFANNCTVCHGVNGEGSDIGLPLNTPEIRATDEAELTRIINEGVPATMMAGWSNALELSEIESIVAFLQNWDVIEGAGMVLTPPEPIQIDLNNPEEVLALGERLYSTICATCHGENGSGGTGPVLNSQQILTRNTDEQLTSTIINGGRRPNSTMPAFGDRLTMVEIEALVDYLRAWEPTAPNVANPRGTAQGGGPPWAQATPDANNQVSPQGNQGQGYRGGANPDFQRGGGQSSATAVPNTTVDQTQQGPALSFSGEVVSNEGNMLTFRSDADGALVDAMLGPPFFWEANAIALSPGDKIELEGFESTDHMEINWLTNKTTGVTLELRTADGMPVWTQ
ncbi:MAG: c-type cytochrome [Ardenticatenaceae bacterium]|nr:c-type cytochrome [Ardenticatenaceae bacterium]